MSDPQSNLNTLTDSPQLGAHVARAAATCFASVSPARSATCLSFAIDIALKAAQRFEPRYAGVPEVKWCGPQGQAAPPMTFPKDFVDRRTTLAWSLYRLTVATPVAEPIFSAQACVTMHSGSLATFSNFNAPAATVISSLHNRGQLQELDLPEVVKRELKEAATPIVFVVLNQMMSFEDVILYTSLFNFAHAFAAFQSGPWQSLKETLMASQPVFDQFSLLERRAIERGALASLQVAWEATSRLPLDSIQHKLISGFAHALSAVKSC